MDKHPIAVAIDGPAAAGKSTIAKRVASILGFTYIDTGAMYRAFTYAVIKRGLDPQDEKASCSIIPEVTIDLLDDGRVLCCGEDVTKQIREPLVSGNVSYIASYKDIRLALVDIQRAMSKSKSVIMDGRDIGTVVLPNAEVKIYLTASPHTRAIRRFRELEQKKVSEGEEPLSPTLAALDINRIEKDIRERDYRDSHREISPLKQASDAVLIDSSDLTIDEVVVRILDIVDARNRQIRDKHITYSDVQN